MITIRYRPRAWVVTHARGLIQGRGKPLARVGDWLFPAVADAAGARDAVSHAHLVRPAVPAGVW